jgi:hypothetical protein
MGWSGAPGLVFFDSVVFINLFFISLAGLSYFSSAITEEKEEMTLGLLRMTNLNPLSILLGKSASRQVGALLLLASQLPFTLLAVALGGVTTAQIIAAYVCLGAYTLFLGNMALCFSVIARRTAHAAIFTGLTLFVFLFGAALIRGPILSLVRFFKIVASDVPGPRLTAFLDAWQQTSPMARLMEIGVTGFHDGAICFQVVSNVLLGLAFFLVAWGVFDVFCNEQPDAAPSRGLLARSNKRLRFFSPGRPVRRALIWKDFHFLGGGYSGVLGKFIAYGCLLGAVLYMQHYYDIGGINWDLFGYTTIWTMMFALSVEVAFVAARVFRQERIWKTWSSLAMLPMSARRIAYQKILGCLLSCWPALFFLGVGGAFVMDNFFNFAGQIIKRGDVLNQAFSWVAISGIVFSILQTLLFYHLIADLSLRLKWGALPLSIAIGYIGTTFMAMMSFLMFREAAFFVLDGVALVLVILLHIDIGNRLHQIAAED